MIDLQQYRLSNIRVAIADSTEISCQTTRSILHNIGVRDFVVTHTLSDTTQALRDREFDLLIYNSHLNDEETASLVREIRHGDIGADPFVPVVSLSWEPSIEIVGHLVNAGSDLLLTLPLSADKVHMALESLIEQRKPFLVTSNYIGPDRRRSVRAGSPQIQMTVVPNSLRRKALGKDAVPDADAASQSVFEQRIERYISRITFTVGKISGLYSGKDEGTFKCWLVDLEAVAKNLSRRITTTRYAQHVTLSDTLIEVVDSMNSLDVPSADDLQTLQQIALALEIAIKEDDTNIIEDILDVEKAVEALKSA